MEQAEYGIGMSMGATMSRGANSSQGPVRWDADHAYLLPFFFLFVVMALLMSISV